MLNEERIELLLKFVGFPGANLARLRITKAAAMPLFYWQT